MELRRDPFSGFSGFISGYEEKIWLGSEAGQAAANPATATRTLHLDFETRSTVDLPKVGAWVYAGHPDTEVLVCCYAVDGGLVKRWTPGDPTPPEIIEAATNPDWLVYAHNAQFERYIWQHVVGPQYGWPSIPLAQWRCSQARVLALALPGRLETAATALGLKHQKDVTGHKLMRRMSKPRKARKGEDPSKVYYLEDPSSLTRLYYYCAGDVSAERELVEKTPPLVPQEQELWGLCAKINDRGFYTDGELIEGALKIVRETPIKINAELQAVTSGAVPSFRKDNKLKPWLAARGCELQNLQKETVAAALGRDDLSPEVRRVLELRQAGSHAASHKMVLLSQNRGADGRVRGAFRFHGASTGRWTSHGVQVQNLKRPQTKDLDALVADVISGEECSLSEIGDLARAIICAAPGHRLIAADFSGVESRLTAWVSGQKDKVEAWARFDCTQNPHDEPYYLNGVAMQFSGDFKQVRSGGKTSDLAFGYMGGVGAWRKLSRNDGLSDVEVKAKQRLWRERHPEIFKMWYALDRAAKAATNEHGVVFAANDKVSFEHDGKFLWMHLPSGRRLAYPDAHLKETDREKVVVFKDNARGGWVDCRGGDGAYGGTWIENLVQAVARDGDTSRSAQLAGMHTEPAPAS
jgi:DNA polymerase